MDAISATSAIGLRTLYDGSADAIQSGAQLSFALTNKQNPQPK